MKPAPAFFGSGPPYLPADESWFRNRRGAVAAHSAHIKAWQGPGVELDMKEISANAFVDRGPIPSRSLDRVLRTLGKATAIWWFVFNGTHGPIVTASDIGDVSRAHRVGGRIEVRLRNGRQVNRCVPFSQRDAADQSIDEVRLHPTSQKPRHSSPSDQLLHA